MSPVEEASSGKEDSNTSSLIRSGSETRKNNKQNASCECSGYNTPNTNPIQLQQMAKRPKAKTKQKMYFWTKHALAQQVHL